MKTHFLFLALGIFTACESQKKTTSFSSGQYMNDPILKAFQPKEKEFDINPTKDTLLKVNNRGSILHIKANSFLTKNGQKITSTVRITFKEYTNSADIAFSGIPMTISKGNEEFVFNSAGMFEISGKTAHENVKINPNKPLFLDYALTQNIPNTDFYKLKDNSANWELIQKIPTLKEEAAPLQVSNLEDDRLLEITFEDQTMCPEFKKYKGVKFRIIDENKFDKNDLEMLYYQVGLEKTSTFGKYLITFGGYDENAQFVVRKYFVSPEFTEKTHLHALKNYETIFHQAEKEALAYMENLKIEEEKLAIQQKAENDNYEKQLQYQAKLNEELLKREAMLFQNQQNNRQPFLSPEYLQDPGHTYPAIVKELRIASFGIYNCDQAYRMNLNATITPEYVDEQGEKINNCHVLSLININQKSAFSFNPVNFQYNSESKFVIALFTFDKKLFILDSDAVVASTPNTEGKTILKMIDKTAKIKNSDDLRKLLGV